MKSLALLCVLLFIPANVMAASLSVHNERLQVAYDDALHQFSLSTYPQREAFIQTGQLALSGSARTTDVTDPVYGDGQAIEVTSADGQSVRLIAFSKLPFILIRQTLKNTTAQARVLNKVPILTFSPTLASPAKDLKILGTGGLASAQQPGGGSYEWLVVADEQSRHGLLACWMTQWRATGLFFPHYQHDQLTIEARTEFGRLRLTSGQAAETETLALGYFDDVRLGLETWANELARTYAIKLRPQPAVYCTWYSDQHGGSSDEASLAKLSDFVGQQLKPYGMTSIQIDDGWQLGDSHGNGPRHNFTDFNPQGPYPSGMKQIAHHIQQNGLVAGLWFMPFAGTYNDNWFADKQAMFVKRADGKPYDTAWGGTCLDMTNPLTQQYVRGIVSKVSGDWGFNYFKLDGFWTGLASGQVYVNSDYKDDGFGDAVFSDPAKTNVQVLRDGMKLVRQAAGPGVFILGCNVAQNMRTYGGSFGTLDAMRIGPDNGGDWKAWLGSSPVFGSRSYFLNGRVWYNDPDPCYVRASMTRDEARTDASWTAISGQLYSNSDWIPGLPAERLEILKRTVMPHGKIARPVDYLENDPPRVWQVIDDAPGGRRDVVALYNWTDAPQRMDVPTTALDLPAADRYAAFDFWANAQLPDVEHQLSSTLPPHACQIIAIRPMVDHPFVLSTSRHVTQGMVDLSAEAWDANKRLLSGSSKLIAGDPYELRITSAQLEKWRVEQVRLDAASQAAGASISVTAGTPLRVLINAPKGGIISWQVEFKPPQ